MEGYTEALEFQWSIIWELDPTKPQTEVELVWRP
jgi:hypothetical protein